MKTFFILMLLLSSSNAETLLVQTESGNISVTKDLDAKLCKIMLAKIKCVSNCLCTGVDDEGNTEQKSGYNSCTSSVTGSTFKMGECLK